MGLVPEGIEIGNNFMARCRGDQAAVPGAVAKEQGEQTKVVVREGHRERSYFMKSKASHGPAPIVLPCSEANNPKLPTFQSRPQGLSHPLIGGAVDYGASALDVAIQAYANVGADIRRFAVTGRLPLFAVVTSPKTASQIQSIKDLEGRTVGISALGNADHALTLYLLKQAGANAQKVQFATVGVNLLEALRQGQMDVGVVQEPALTLLRRSGARVLMNGMDLEDARHYLGGSFEFMGVAVRAKEIEQRRPEMVALTKALADALKALRGMTGEQLVAALPKEMTTGLDLKEFGDIIVHHRDSLYPETVNIDLEAAKRVEQSLIAGGLIKSGASMSGLHDTTIVGG